MGVTRLGVLAMPGCECVCESRVPACLLGIMRIGVERGDLRFVHLCEKRERHAAGRIPALRLDTAQPESFSRLHVDALSVASIVFTMSLGRHRRAVIFPLSCT